MVKKQKPIKSKEEKMIEDIKDRLSGGEELRDVARRHDMSCRAVCRLVAETPKEDPPLFDFSDSSNLGDSEDGYIDPGFE